LHFRLPHSILSMFTRRWLSALQRVCRRRDAVALDRDGPQGGRPATNLSAVPVKTEAKILSLSRSETPSYQLHACFEKFVAIMEVCLIALAQRKGCLTKPSSASCAKILNVFLLVFRRQGELRMLKRQLRQAILPSPACHSPWWPQPGGFSYAAEAYGPGSGTKMPFEIPILGIGGRRGGDGGCNPYNRHIR
jgi:hypothetical protein